MIESKDLQAKIKVMSDIYAEQLPEKIKQIEKAWNQLSPSKWDDNELQTLHRMVHNLTGTGKIFGFALLSDAARNLEDALNELVLTKTIPNEEQHKNLQISLNNLKRLGICKDGSEDNVC